MRRTFSLVNLALAYLLLELHYNERSLRVFFGLAARLQGTLNTFIRGWISKRASICSSTAALVAPRRIVVFRNI